MAAIRDPGPVVMNMEHTQTEQHAAWTVTFLCPKCNDHIILQHICLFQGLCRGSKELRTISGDSFEGHTPPIHPEEHEAGPACFRGVVGRPETA